MMEKRTGKKREEPEEEEEVEEERVGLVDGNEMQNEGEEISMDPALLQRCGRGMIHREEEDMFSRPVHSQRDILPTQEADSESASDLEQSLERMEEEEEDPFYEEMIERRNKKKQEKEERKKYQELHVNEDYVGL